GLGYQHHRSRLSRHEQSYVLVELHLSHRQSVRLELLVLYPHAGTAVATALSGASTGGALAVSGSTSGVAAGVVISPFLLAAGAINPNTFTVSLNGTTVIQNAHATD